MEPQNRLQMFNDLLYEGNLINTKMQKVVNSFLCLIANDSFCVVDQIDMELYQ